MKWEHTDNVLRMYLVRMYLLQWSLLFYYFLVRDFNHHLSGLHERHADDLDSLVRSYSQKLGDFTQEEGWGWYSLGLSCTKLSLAHIVFLFLVNWFQNNVLKNRQNLFWKSDLILINSGSSASTRSTIDQLLIMICIVTICMVKSVW